MWFNPPFNANISTNVAKTFLRLIDKHFTRSYNLTKFLIETRLKSVTVAPKTWQKS